MILHQANYDIELLTLQETIQQKVVTLLSDPDNSVKRTLLENGITKLCVFFGRQKGSSDSQYSFLMEEIILTCILFVNKINKDGVINKNIYYTFLFNTEIWLV